MSDDYEFRAQTADRINMAINAANEIEKALRTVDLRLEKIEFHIDNLYKLAEFSECGCPSHRDQTGKITVNPKAK